MMQAVRIDSKDRPIETWADPASGSIRWQTLMSRGLTDTAGMVCGIAHLDTGMDLAAHHHAEAEIYFGLDGEGTILIEGTPHQMAPVVAIYVPSNAVHGVPKVSSRCGFCTSSPLTALTTLPIIFRPLRRVCDARRACNRALAR